MEWQEPWWSTAEQTEEFHRVFAAELAAEVGPDHPLAGVPVRLIARGEGDDALFRLEDGSGRVALVHLTWANRPERLPWPRTAIFDSLETWARAVMQREG